VTVRDEQWATLVLMEHGARLNGFDLLISRRTATLVALELSAERRALSAEWNAKASLAGELIRGNCDLSQLESQARFLGVALDHPHVVCLLAAPGDDSVALLSDSREAAAALAGPSDEDPVLATGVAEGIAVIARLDGALATKAAIDKIKHAVAAAALMLDPQGRIVVGISTVCREPSDYVRAYRQARDVVECLNRFHAGGMTVLAADDLGASRWLLAMTDAGEADRFARDTLGPLIDDNPAGGLVMTLAAFFECGRNIRNTARALNLHENTIRYRLNRVDELTGLPVSADSEAQLSAHLALLVLRLQGRVPARTSDAPGHAQPAVS
jgi:sugar diacid utilization regulator